jgi:ribosomal protein S27AE
MMSRKAPMVSEAKLVCPKCGSEMNFHGEKLTLASAAEEGYDDSLGGVLQEFHSCPNCGAGASRIDYRGL